MTFKQKLFLKNLFKIYNGAEAARLAGYSNRSAKEIACMTLKKAHIKAEFDKWLIKEGLNF